MAKRKDELADDLRAAENAIEDALRALDRRRVERAAEILEDYLEPPEDEDEEDR